MEAIFNTKRFKEFNLYIVNSNHLDKHEKNLTFIKVPGRSDDLIIDNGDYNNMDVSIECLLKLEDKENIKPMIDEIDQWLNVKGYNELKFEDGTILKACFKGALTFEYISDKTYRTTLTFSTYKEV